PYMRGLDPILGLDEPTPEQPALAVRRLVAVLAAAFSNLPKTAEPRRQSSPEMI
ncbi:MAG TPA: TetR/AcrR family transcriptional regulator, partial [Mycobacterium sp.]|nr:TetR/AcrR family transcriptional regulator [Mycobacterium sp.]